MKYIFGYGSLILTAGINGRGMNRVYQERDLHIAKLYGYRREWNACWDNDLFLGLTKSNDHFVNGIIFPIDDKDIQPFLESEGFRDTLSIYSFEDVTQSIVNHQLDSEDRVFTCVTVNPTANGKIPLYYIQLIKAGLKRRGEAFKLEFIKTTFPNMPEGYYDF